MKLHPFVKWVGGKTQLIPEIVPHISEDIDVYVEPFVGGGAIFFEVLETKLNIKKYIINDLNSELINTYKCIRDNCDELISELHILSDEFNKSVDKKEYFKLIRKKYNSYSYSEVSAEQAARFIFLNRTCFNGLYRVNKRGQFNVPFNNLSELDFDYDNLKSINSRLACIDLIILNKSYEAILSDLDNAIFKDEKVFIYLDPPYKPVKADGNEVSYTAEGFGDKAQEELKTFCDCISARGFYFIESNSDPNESKYFDNLYNEYLIKRIYARRNINSDATKRGKINEVLISNFNITWLESINLF